MLVRTHSAISQSLCGSPRSIRPGFSCVVLEATEDMRVDDSGLVHGGFVYGLADHAAMLAVNTPYVVLGSSQSRFLAPVRVGQELIAEARVQADQEGRKRRVEVTVSVGSDKVFEGVFTTFSLDNHVLEG